MAETRPMLEKLEKPQIQKALKCRTPEQGPK